MSRRRRAALLLGLALVLGGLAASDVAQREAVLDRRLGPLRPILVTSAAVPPRARLARQRLSVRPIPARFAPPGALSTPADAEGLRAAVALPAGAYLTSSVLVDPEAAGGTGAPVRRGERVAEVVAVAPASLVVPGSHVDVLVTREGRDGTGGRTRLALQDVEVLAASAAEAGSGEGATAGPRVRASLRVSVRQAVYLAAAQSFARELRLLPRAAGDRRPAGALIEGSALG